MTEFINKIGVLGDSILKGVVLDEISGKYKLLKETAASLFATGNKVALSDCSKFGCTSAKALQRLPKLLENENAPQAILIELGGNDCDFNWDEVCLNPNENHAPNTPLRDFRLQVTQIVLHIIRAGKLPFVMNLPPIDSDRYFNWITGSCKKRAENLLKFLGDKSLIYRHQELYSRTLESIARRYGLYIVNVRGAFLGIHKYTDYLCMDGIHPNERGQQIIRQVFDEAYNQNRFYTPLC